MLEEPICLLCGNLLETWNGHVLSPNSICDVCTEDREWAG